MRFYGFTHDEIVPPSQGSAGSAPGMLALDMDPKLAWALAHRERFPVNLNTAPRELLLRVPGFGVQTVDRLLAARRVRRGPAVGRVTRLRSRSGEYSYCILAEKLLLRCVTSGPALYIVGGGARARAETASK